MGTFYNGANCDIYIGKGVGKKLFKEQVSFQNQYSFYIKCLFRYVLNTILLIFHLELHADKRILKYDKVFEIGQLVLQVIFSRPQPLIFF